MQEQLRRIKNKDLKSLDERLFGNLDKVQTINSTIQNLGQFQQYLLKQISQFEEKAKTKNKSKEVTEVIEMNCLTLRESIMNVVPDDMEGSQSRMRQTVTSPINGFRSTRGNFKKDVLEQESFRVHECKETELMRKVEELETFKQNSIKREEKLKEELSKIKNEEVKSLTEMENLRQENEKLKEQARRLKQENNKLSKQIQASKEESERQRNMQQLFQNPLQISTELTKPNPQHSSLLRKSQLKEQQPKDPQYMSFKDKMKFDFTSKLTKYHNSEVKLEKNLGQSQNPQGSDSYRESSNLNLTVFDSTYDQQSQNVPFKSIEVSRNFENDLDPNVPKILKRNSISGHKHHDSSISQESLAYKIRVPLANYDSNMNSRSQYQSSQKTTQVRDSSTGKKANHDLMRKTKSNFFKQPVQNKQNSDAFYDTNIAKMKGLVDQSNPSERKRNSQSKQKLKIFSMM